MTDRLEADRLRSLRTALDTPPEPELGGRSFVARTVQVTTYPTSAGVYYGMKRVVLGGAEVEGGTPSKTLTGDVFYALNLGASVPVVGTDCVVHETGGRISFRFG